MKSPWASGGCGGTIICEKFVMTAAHCIDLLDSNGNYHLLEPSQVKVFAEEHSQWDASDHVEHSVEAIHPHPDWNSNALNFDFALLELSKPLDLSRGSKARAACLPDMSDSRIFKDGTTFVASGWGRHVGGHDPSSPDILRKVDLPWLPKQFCGVSAPIICTGNSGEQGVCQGDSGGKFEADLFYGPLIFLVTGFFSNFVSEICSIATILGLELVEIHRVFGYPANFQKRQ